VAVGDFNGDGKLDLAVANEGSNTVSILLGDGTGNFTAASSTSTGTAPQSVAMGDFNGDGKLDLAVANEGSNTVSDSNTVSILLGDGTGNFTTASSAATGEAPLSVAVGDFNGDGKLDLAAVTFDGGVSVLLQAAPEAGVPSSLAFGNQNLGSHNTLALTITNTGTAAINITGTSLSGPNSADFTAALNTCSSPVSPGGNCSLNVIFTPSLAGAESATLTVTDNAGSGTQTVSLSGTGIALAQTITFNTIPNQVQGSALALTATANSGLTVSYTSSTLSVCTVSGSTATFVNPGTCTIVASQNGNNVYAAATPVSQSLTVIPRANFSITPEPAVETVYRGRLAAFLLVLNSVNGFKGNVTVSCSGGPAGSECADFPQTVRVNGTAYAISGILFPTSTPPGTYTMTFTGVSGSLTNNATATFIVK
jgi:hypothetical protein